MRLQVPCETNRACGERERSRDRARSRQLIRVLSAEVLELRCRNFVIQTQRLFVTGERPDAQHHWNGRAAADALFKIAPMFGIEEGLRHSEMRAGFDFFAEALDFVLHIFRDRIHRDSDCEIGLTAESFSGPIHSLIEARENFTRPTESTSKTPLISG